MHLFQLLHDIGLANEAMDAKRSWITVTEDSSDEESEEEEAPDDEPGKGYAEV